MAETRDQILRALAYPERLASSFRASPADTSQGGTDPRAVTERPEAGSKPETPPAEPD